MADILSPRDSDNEVMSALITFTTPYKLTQIENGQRVSFESLPFHHFIIMKYYLSFYFREMQR